MKQILLACAVVFCLQAGLNVADAADKNKAGSPLDGKTYAVKIGQPGKPQSDDKLSFDNGTFGSDLCMPLGFVRVKYGASRGHGDMWTFTAETKSPKEGKTTWKGTVKGNDIGGYMIWNKEGQAPVRYLFTGTLATK